MAGLVYNPANDETFIAERGKGAFFNDRRIRVAGAQRLSERWCAAACRISGAATSRCSAASLRVVQEKVAGLRRFGAAALDLCWIAAGRFDCYWERNLSPWDFAAGVIIVREAGGYVTDLDGNERTMLSRATSSPATRTCSAR